MMVMRCQTSVPLTEAKPVLAPYRGCANHQFTGGSDFCKVSKVLILCIKNHNLLLLSYYPAKIFSRRFFIPRKIAYQRHFKGVYKGSNFCFSPLLKNPAKKHFYSTYNPLSERKIQANSDSSISGKT